MVTDLTLWQAIPDHNARTSAMHTNGDEAGGAVRLSVCQNRQSLSGRKQHSAIADFRDDR
jgi:hypothetical protein